MNLGIVEALFPHGDKSDALKCARDLLSGRKAKVLHRSRILVSVIDDYDNALLSSLPVFD